MLKNVDILNSEINIGDYAFSNCADNLLIKGYAGSNVEIYANEWGLLFEPIKEENDSTKSDKSEVMAIIILFIILINIVVLVCVKKHKKFRNRTM